MIWNKNKCELPDEEDMGFQNLVKDRIYTTIIANANECKGFNPQQIALGKSLIERSHLLGFCPSHLYAHHTGFKLQSHVV